LPATPRATRASMDRARPLAPSVGSISNRDTARCELCHEQVRQQPWISSLDGNQRPEQEEQEELHSCREDLEGRQYVQVF
jgi:hypothetical protein